MAIIKNKISNNLAQNVFELRKKNGLTQSSLANLAELTRGSITLIESGDSNPTLEVLLKLSKALLISIDELISFPKAECLLIPASMVPLDRRSKNGVTLRKLLPEKIRATEMDEISLKADAVMTGSPHVEGTREYFTCIDGQITVGVLGQKYELKKGDVLSFPGDKKHSYKNSGSKLARGVSVVFFNSIK